MVEGPWGGGQREWLTLTLEQGEMGKSCQFHWGLYLGREWTYLQGSKGGEGTGETVGEREAVCL